jgi:hypothetical protein
MPPAWISMRIPPVLKAWREWEVDWRKNTGDRQANMTARVVAVLEATAKATNHDPVFA